MSSVSTKTWRKVEGECTYGRGIVRRTRCASSQCPPRPRDGEFGWGGWAWFTNEGGKGSSAASFIGRVGALRGRTLGRLSLESRRLDGWLMASINRSLKAGVEWWRWMPSRAPGSARKKEGGANKRAPLCSERERGRESADRRALPCSEMGKGEGARAVRGGAGRATGPRARRGRGAESWAATAQGQGWALGGARPGFLGLGQIRWRGYK